MSDPPSRDAGATSRGSRPGFSTPERRASIVAAAGASIPIAAVLLMAAAPLYTDDLWWHLSAGELYLTEGLWPRADATLHTALDGGPVQHEWLFGVGVYLVEGAGGLHGLRVLRFAAVAGILWLVWSLARRASRAPATATLALTVFAVLAAPRLAQLRPDLLSIGAALLGYRLLIESGASPGRGRVAAFVALVVVWANAHSLFLVGINLVVAAVLGILLDRTLARAIPGERETPATSGRRLRRWLAAIAIALLAAGLNPRGFAQHLTFVTSSHGAAIWLIADEWSAFHPFSPGANHASMSALSWLLADLVIGGFVLAALAGALGFGRARSAEALARFDAVHFGLGLAGVVALLVSIRFAWMLVFPMLYVLRALAWAPGGARTVLAWSGAAAVLAVAAVVPSGATFASLMTRFASEPAAFARMPYRSHKYHAEGVRFLQATGISGNLYNPYWMGGFLGYWLRPRLRVFIDGRTEHYDASVYEDYSAVLSMRGSRDGEVFADVLDRRGVDLFFGVGFPGWWLGIYTTTYLEQVPGWIPVSRSYRHAISLRGVPRNAPALERIAAWYRAEGVPFDPAIGFEPDRVIRERPDWAMAHAMLPPDYPELLASARAPDPARAIPALERLSVLLLLNGAYREQIEIARRRLSIDPAAHEPRLRLAFSLLRVGEIDEGLAIAEAAAVAEPGDPRARRLLGAGREIERVRARLSPSQRGLVERVFVNRLLIGAMPLTADDTWPVEYSVETEREHLTRPPR